jgi:undecaprenyl phosphate N,N'-diacetylbacillosamine 1-phosphate transferase
MIYAKYVKRILDIVMAVTLLLITSWIFALIILAYIISNWYPIFFRQQRIGKRDSIFELIKFRTLLKTDSPKENRRFFLGNFLRATSLDELPQLIQVVRGEMSLIGPRPLLVEYLPLFSNVQRQRHQVSPGITGWAQVNGRNSISWQEKFELDLYYVNNISFLLDLKILLKTFILVLSFKKDTSLHEKKFTG